MAEFVMKDMLRKAGRNDVVVDSAALHTDELGHDMHRGTRAELSRRGIPFTPRAAWLLTPERAQSYDLIIGMDSMNMSDLQDCVYPSDIRKLRKLMEFAGSQRDIADPWYTGDFEATWRDVLEGCQKLLQRL